MLSFWEKGWMTNYDYLIVGGGIVGLSTAITIKEKLPEARVIVVEKGLLPSGASTKNAGFACFGSLTELLADINQWGTDRMLDLVRQRWSGLQRLRGRLGDKAIELRVYGGYELLKEEQLDAKDQLDYVNELLFPLFNQNVFEDESSRITTFGFSGDSITSLIFNPLEGQINTGKMMTSLISLAREKGVQLMTGGEVEGFHLNDGLVHVEVRDNQHAKSMTLRTEKLAICNNAFAKQLLPDITLKPGRGQVLVTTPIDGLPFKGTFHMDEGFYYFRNYENRVLLGGGRNLDFEGETTLDFETTDKIINHLKDILSQDIIPGRPFDIAHQWAGIMAFGENKSPILKKINDQVVVGVRLGGMGVAIGSQLADELCDLITQD